MSTRPNPVAYTPQTRYTPDQLWQEVYNDLLADFNTSEERLIRGSCNRATEQANANMCRAQLIAMDADESRRLDRYGWPVCLKETSNVK